MIRLLLRRVVLTVPLLLVVSFGVFGLMAIAPGDAARTVAGPAATEAEVEETRARLGLDRPLLERYGDWLSDVVRGDLGTSLTTGEEVRTTLARRLPITLSLAAVSLVMTISVGLVLGVISALRPGGPLDRILGVVASIGVAMPSFWAGMLLVTFLAIDRTWMPALGYVHPTEGIWPWLQHLMLPGISLALLPIAEVTRQLRTSMVDTLERDYITTARAKGLRSWKVVVKHGLKNAAIPPITALGFRIAQMLGGAVVVEQLFLLNGMGSLAVLSVQSRDSVTVLNLVMFTTLVVVVVNIIVDASYTYFNPKMRTS